MAANPHDEDVEIMLAVQRDSPGAFDQLVLNYQQRLAPFFFRMLGSSNAIEDLVQDVFLKVYQSRKSYAPTGKFSTWIFQIASNVGLTFLRRGRTNEVRLGAELAEIAPSASGEIPTRIYEKLESDLIVQAAVECLSPRERTAIVLSKFEGLSYAEIARALETTVPAVRSLLTRARGRLRDMLIRYQEQGKRPGNAGA